MFIRRSVLIPVLFLLFAGLNGQDSTYTISKALFSSDLYDEFCPVYYQGGIVFCSNRNSNFLSNYSSSEGNSLFNIFYIDTTAKVSWQRAELLSKSLKTAYNDGPASFSQGGDTVFFSRNQKFEGKLKKNSNPRNKLGVFMAVKDGKKWNRIKEFRFNSEWYNITTPYLSPDRQKLYFASDRSDSYGGADIYYSQWKNGYWGEPVNLGPVVNTKGNESYPFINEVGELFFSSDGHPGLGGKDIFVTKQNGNGWYPPVRLDAPVNSGYDDFGIVTDLLMNEGYFSSNRDKTIDIYRFRSDLHQVWFSEPQKDNRYCFTISDTGSIIVDTLRLQYEWDFGDDSKIYGTNVKHCFPGPGSYSVNLNITDRRTGSLFFHKLRYDIEIVDNEQPFINSADYAVSGETVDFDGLESFCPGYTITDYFWDFGDETFGNGERVSHKFNESGEYYIKLGLTLKSKATGKSIKRAVSKKVMVLWGEQEKAQYVAGMLVMKQDSVDIRQSENVIVNGHYSAETDFMQEALFRVELVSSSTRVDLNSSFFRNVPAKYHVSEILNAEDNTYSYIVDQQMTLMASWPAYLEMISSGYTDARVRIVVLEDPAQIDLHNLKKRYGLLSDTYFNANNRLLTNAILMLNQVAGLMNKYPDISIEVGVHTDNLGSVANNLTLSKNRAQVMIDYLISTGMNRDRLVAKGYGEARQVASNMLEKDRRLNRRVDFTILD